MCSAMEWEFRIYIHVTDAEGSTISASDGKMVYLGRVRDTGHQSKSIHVEREEQWRLWDQCWMALLGHVSGPETLLVVNKI